MQQLVILTGLSGAGKTVVLRTLEDMEFYCVDNLPVSMLGNFVSHINADAEFYPKVAVGIDIRSQSQGFDDFQSEIQQLKQKTINIKVVFLNADKKVLIQRFSETRRRHPLSTAHHHYSLTEAVKLEAKLMNSIKQQADLVIDTSGQSALQLKQHIWQLMSMPSDRVSIILKSFAFKRGVPFDADFVFDARCLKNPYWTPELRHLNGKDKKIQDFFAEDDWANDFIKDLTGFSNKWIKRFEANDRSYITIAVGCTGGQHRSVYLIERLAVFLTNQGIDALVLHREISY